MGQNLILNMNDHGFTVCAFNRTTDKVDAFLANEAKGTNVIGAQSLEGMVRTLKKPRRVMMLVKAGKAVDEFIEKLVPLLESGDIIIDGGNSEYQDTARRVEQCAKKGLLFVGSGVSGGEDGARHGPSLMPGGNPAAWPAIKPIFQTPQTSSMTLHLWFQRKSDRCISLTSVLVGFSPTQIYPY
ncbi:hypothetical protein J6590_077401 [Homalodisca vitripennis]|nr:hypothetical protein J6590_077401 [Homalodisca vitripennis]